MKLSLNLQTSAGLDLYNTMASQYEYSKKYNFLTEFKYYLTMKYITLEKRLIEWIDTHDMETETEMGYWKKESEHISVLKYYAERLV